MLISVVIPVYNMQHTLDRCVESVLKQTFDNMEVLLVDDGSTDSSAQKCDSWAEKDARVQVLHQPNGGLSKARNTGIAHAHGDFLAFVDADDAITPNTFEMAINAFERHPQCNIVEFPVVMGWLSNNENLLHFDEQEHLTPAIYWFEEQGYLHAYACNKLWRANLFANVRFPEGKVFEDLITTARLLAKSGNILTINQGAYLYWTNPQGITQKANAYELAQLLVWNMRVSKSIILPNACTKEAKERFHLHLLNMQIDLYRKGDTTIRLAELPLSWHFVINADMPFATRAKAFWAIVFGIKNLCKVHRLLHRLMKTK